jgi:cobalamin 5'-phosphate synthase/cobalamin synthase
MKKVLKGFALSVSMLSTLPFFRVHDFYKGINGYAVMFYPLVGFILGLILYAVYTFLNGYIPSMHLGVVIFALWVVLTGALHLDGFSDTIDGLYVKKERALEVMKDAHNGGMGMIYGGVFLILKASSLAALDAFYLLPLVLTLSRFSTVLAIYNYPYVSSNGMGTLAKEELKLWQVLVAAFYVFVLVAFFNAYLLFFVSLLVLFGIKSVFLKRYGGFTGDIYGFSIEVIELILLNVILIGLV